MPKKTHNLWRALERELFAAHAEWGPDRIEAELWQEHQRRGLPDEPEWRPPKARTISDHKREWVKLGNEERAQDQPVRWPDTFAVGLLPWEAAEAFLELRREDIGSRPTVRLTRWWHRLRLSAPDQPPADALRITRYMAAIEVLGEEQPRSVESYLLLRPWTAQGAEDYKLAVEQGWIEEIDLSPESLAGALSKVYGTTTPRTLSGGVRVTDEWEFGSDGSISHVAEFEWPTAGEQHEEQQP
jgi:hypothetical protein